MQRTLILSGRISLRASATIVATATSGVTLVGLTTLPSRRLTFSSGVDNGNDKFSHNATTSGDTGIPVKVAGLVATAEEKAANDLLWEEKARSCPLCRLFLDSPCAEEFKLFSDCADKAKESGEEVSEACGESDFVKMRRCMEKYPEHFELLFDAEEGIVADDEDDFEEAPTGTGPGGGDETEETTTSATPSSQTTTKS